MKIIRILFIFLLTGRLFCNNPELILKCYDEIRHIKEGYFIIGPYELNFKGKKLISNTIEIPVTGQIENKYNIRITAKKNKIKKDEKQLVLVEYYDYQKNYFQIIPFEKKVLNSDEIII